MGWGSRCVVLAFAAAIGCGLDQTGTGPATSAAIDDAGAPGDAGGLVDAAVAPPIGDAAWPTTGPTGCACGLTVPAGFTEVAYEDGRAAACPSDMTAFDLVTGPTAGAGACTCAACVVTAMPSCASGDFSSDFDQNSSSNATCDTPAISHRCNDGACTAANGTYGEHGRAVPPPPSGTGTCAARGVANAGAVQWLPARACAETATRCACDPSLAPAFHACLRAPGDVACPRRRRTSTSRARARR